MQIDGLGVASGSGQSMELQDWQACLDAVAVHLHNPALARAIRLSDAAMTAPAAVAARASMRESGVPLAMAEPPYKRVGPLLRGWATAETLSEQQVGTLRDMLATDLSRVDISRRAFIHPTTVTLRRAALKHALAIDTPRDWLPVLVTLRKAGRLSESEFALAVRTVVATTGEAAEPLVQQMTETGLLPPAEAEAASRAARLRDRGITGQQSELLHQMTLGKPVPDVAAAMGVSVDSIRQIMTALRDRLQIEAMSNHGDDLRCAILVTARDAGLLPPAAAGAAGVAAAEIWERARAQGLRLSTMSAAYLHAANGNATVQDLQRLLPNVSEFYASNLARRLGAAGVPPTKGRRVQHLLETARRLDLLPPASLPDPAMEPVRYKKLAGERFGLDPGQVGLLLALQAAVSHADPAVRLVQMAQRLNHDPQQVGSDLRALAAALGVTETGRRADRIAARLIDWATDHGVGPDMNGAQREALARLPRAGRPLTPSQVALLIDLKQAGSPAAMLDANPRYATNLLVSLRTLAGRLDVSSLSDDPAALIDPTLDAARRAGLLPPP